MAWDQRPDRRTRRALLHLSYSCAQPFGPATLVTHDPMYGPAVRCKRKSVNLEHSGLAPMYPALRWSSWAPGHHGYERAFDLISGQASSGLFGSPVFACAGKTGCSIVLLSLSQTSVGMLLWVFAPAPAQAGAHPRASILTFVRPRRRLTSAPTAGWRGRRAQMLSRLARPGPPVDAEHRFAMTGLALTASSTTARSSCRGLLTRAGTRVRTFSSSRSRGRGAARSRRCARACWRARSPARCGAAAGRPPRSRA